MDSLSESLARGRMTVLMTNLCDNLGVKAPGLLEVVKDDAMKVIKDAVAGEVKRAERSKAGLDELSKRYVERADTIAVLLAQHADTKGELRRACRQLEDQKEIIRVERERVAKERRRVVELAAKAGARTRNAEEMVARIVAVMTDEGYDIAGWGNDAELTELEAVNAELSEGTIKLGAKLNEIRTQRP